MNSDADIGFKLPRSFVRDVLLAGLFFAVLYIGFLQVDEEIKAQQYNLRVLTHASVLLNTVFGEECELSVKSVEGFKTVNTLRSPEGFFVVVPPDAEQLLICAMMLAVIAGLSAPALYKVIGALLGVVYFYALDVIRISAMFLIEVYKPAWFPIFKVGILPLLFILLVAAYLTLWLVLARRQ